MLWLVVQFSRPLRGLGVISKAKRRGAHRRKRVCKPPISVMLRRDGSRCQYPTELSVWHPDGWFKAKLSCPACITSLVEGQQLGACFAGREVQRIGKVDPITTMAQCCLDLVAILDDNPRQRDQMRQAFRHLVSRLIGDIAQHQLELEDHGLWNKDVAGRKHVRGNPSSRR
jgi:hypothetical protein